MLRVQSSTMLTLASNGCFRYEKPNLPCLLTDVTNTWAATTNWTFQVCATTPRPRVAFLHHTLMLCLSSCAAPLLQCLCLQALYRKYRHQMFRCGEDDDGHAVKMKLKYFLRYARHQTDDSPMYIFDSHFPDSKKVGHSLQEKGLVTDCLALLHVLPNVLP